MKKETLDEFLKRGGQIKKVDFSQAYKRLTPKFINYEKKRKLKDLELQRQKQRDANSYRGVV